MGGIGVILNPRSKRNLGDPRAATRLARALGDHGVVRTVRTRDDLPRIAEDFRRQKIDVLGISGGDGTNYVTITGFLDVYDTEPLPADHPLRALPNALLTPHIGYVSRELYETFYGDAVADIAAFAAGSPVRVMG